MCTKCCWVQCHIHPTEVKEGNCVARLGRRGNSCWVHKSQGVRCSANCCGTLPHPCSPSILSLQESTQKGGFGFTRGPMLAGVVLPRTILEPCHGPLLCCCAVHHLMHNVVPLSARQLGNDLLYCPNNAMCSNFTGLFITNLKMPLVGMCIAKLCDCCLPAMPRGAYTLCLVACTSLR